MDGGMDGWTDGRMDALRSPPSSSRYFSSVDLTSSTLALARFIRAFTLLTRSRFCVVTTAVKASRAGCEAASRSATVRSRCRTTASSATSSTLNSKGAASSAAAGRGGGTTTAAPAPAPPPPAAASAARRACSAAAAAAASAPVLRSRSLRPRRRRVRSSTKGAASVDPWPWTRHSSVPMTQVTGAIDTTIARSRHRMAAG